MSTDPDDRPPSARMVAVTLNGLSRWTAPRATAAGAPAGRPRVVIVDDEPSLRMLLRVYLEEDFSVVEAEDGLSALERFALDKPDLVVLDLVMKGMYGLDVLSKLRELDPAARVIVLTADIQTSSRELVQSAGASAFINKPATPAAVVEMVQRVLEGTAPWN